MTKTISPSSFLCGTLLSTDLFAIPSFMCKWVKNSELYQAPSLSLSFTHNTLWYLFPQLASLLLSVTECVYVDVFGVLTK